MRRRRALVGGLLALSLLAGGGACGGAGSPGPRDAAPRGAAGSGASPGIAAPDASPTLEKIAFAVPQVNGVTMPYAIALQQGFFREAGLDVEISVLRTNL